MTQINLPKKKKHKKTVGYVQTDESVNAIVGEKYLCFLAYDENIGKYIVQADAYGMRLENDSKKFFSPLSKKYESIEFVK